MRKSMLLAMFLVATMPMGQAQEVAKPSDYTAHVVGTAHTDMVWLWRREETVHDILYNTFRNQLKLMDQYPDFTFAQDHAVAYEMMEKYYPEIFKAITEKVKTGNWIPISSTWVQMDENMPDGESLVRQFLYGQKYTKEKFGRYARAVWQPDVFGHPYSMPQIARKAGVEFYVFNRPDDPKRPPIIRWQGLDGSRVIGYNPTGCGWRPFDHKRAMKEAQRAGVKNILLIYGEGDHGGGPTPDEVAALAKMGASPDEVRVKPTNVNDYIDTLLAEKKDFPIWDGEHNFVFMGCFTTQVEMKRNNRLAEQLLLTAEKFSTLAAFSGYRDFVPTRDLSESWKLTLLNQCHDFVTGAGIGPIYADAAKQYQEVFERGWRALNSTLAILGRQVNTSGEGIPVVVYNPRSWNATDWVTVEVAAPSLPVKLVAVSGKEVLPVHILKRTAVGGARGGAPITFVAQDVPQMGLKVYRLVPETTARTATAGPLRAGVTPRPFLENEFLRVEFNPATGNIARLYDKQNKREAFRGEGNSLLALEDTQLEAYLKQTGDAGHAWDLGLTGTKWDVNKAERVDLIEPGPARGTIRVVRHFHNSTFTQYVSLGTGIPRVDVEMSVDWHERETLLKAVFPIQVSSKKVAAEIPYGTVEHDQTGTEMVMGKWVDISDGDYGVAILNNGRHGFDAKDNTIRISVIRGAVYPDPRADEGVHSFGYSIYPHKGNWREGKVMFQGLAFNAPLVALEETVHTRPDPRINASNYNPNQWSGLPETFSFVKTESDHVVLYALKQMEGFYYTDPIARFFECEGREGDVTIQFPYPVTATETDLLEDTIGPVGQGPSISFHMKPWEIKTLRLKRVGYVSWHH
jgi:alpha-mannosidase